MSKPAPNRPPMVPLPATAKEKARSSAAPRKPPQPLDRTIRETIESIVIAFVLAFLFRTFEAEAFVIPTGSMAPTLQGRHKDLACENCGYRVRTSASEEERAGEPASHPGANRDQIAADVFNSQVVAVTCPLCRYRTNTSNTKEFPSYNGDRILVAKFPYEFVEPKRWDIVVFKYPNDAKINYIKRLVGLPNETVKIEHGDIFTQAAGTDTFEIQRKNPEKQLAMAQIVYDNNYLVPGMAAEGWPLRWQPWPAEAQQTWTMLEDGRAFSLEESKTDAPVWLRYRHFPPTQTDWRSLAGGGLAGDATPQPQLITDFYAYNAGIMRGGPQEIRSGLHWVGDLMLEATVNVTTNQGTVLLDLVEGGVHFGAAIDVATGEAVLSIDADAAFQPRATTKLKGAGTYRLRFANFDDQLTLWIDETPVVFDTATTYGPLDNDLPKSTETDPGDLAPAGIALANGATGSISNLTLKRDIYYIADKLGTQASPGPLSDYAVGAVLPSRSEEARARYFSNPQAWTMPEADGRSAFELRRSVTFAMDEDQFFVLGDNSPASADSRLWDDDRYFVGREMMIGKALFIYWPHGLTHIPGTGIPFPLGMFPNFRDMGFVR